MEQLYRDRLRAEAGNGYPVPPPRPGRIQEPSEAAEGGDDDGDFDGGSDDGGEGDSGGGGGGGGAGGGGGGGDSGGGSPSNGQEGDEAASPGGAGGKQGAVTDGQQKAAAPKAVTPQSCPGATGPSLQQPGQTTSSPQTADADRQPAPAGAEDGQMHDVAIPTEGSGGGREKSGLNDSQGKATAASSDRACGEQETGTDGQREAAAPKTDAPQSGPGVTGPSLQQPGQTVPPPQTADADRRPAQVEAEDVQMYDPEIPTGVESSDTVDSTENEGSTDSEGHSEPPQDMWQPAPFAAQLGVWGLCQVDAGWRNEAGTKNQCFFVAIREAMAAVGKDLTAVDLRANVLRRLTLPEWSAMGDPQQAATEGLLVRKDYRLPIEGSRDANRQDLTWPAFLEKEDNPGGEGLLSVVAHILGRPVLLLNAGAVPPRVGMHLHLPPTEVEPLGRRLRVHRQGRAFEYFPIRKGRPQWLPSTTIVLVRQAWHYTAAITTAQATWRHARSGQAGNLPLVPRPPPDGPAGPTAPEVEAPAVVVAQGAVSGLARNQGQRDDVRGLPNMGNTCAVNAAT